MATVVTLAHRSVPDSLVFERTKAASEEAALVCHSLLTQAVADRFAGEPPARHSSGSP